MNSKGLRTIKGIGNREQRIRISIYQKLCIVKYTVFDRFKFLFSDLCSLLCGTLKRVRHGGEGGGAECFSLTRVYLHRMRNTITY